MTNDELFKYISFAVNNSLSEIENIEEHLLKNISEDETNVHMMMHLVLNSIKFSSSIAVKTTLKTLDELGVLNLESCSLKELP